MYMIEISDSKVGKLSEHIEESLRHLGKAMQCVDEWMGGDGYGERDSMGYRQSSRYSGGSYGNRYERYGERGSMGYRDDDDDDDDMMGERRGRRRRDTMGRYR